MAGDSLYATTTVKRPMQKEESAITAYLQQQKTLSLNYMWPQDLYQGNRKGPQSRERRSKANFDVLAPFI